MRVRAVAAMLLQQTVAGVTVVEELVILERGDPDPVKVAVAVRSIVVLLQRGILQRLRHWDRVEDAPMVRTRRLCGKRGGSDVQRRKVRLEKGRTRTTCSCDR